MRAYGLVRTPEYKSIVNVTHNHGRAYISRVSNKAVERRTNRCLGAMVEWLNTSDCKSDLLNK